jgi:Leucine-rich repeat (LRR) protein
MCVKKKYYIFIYNLSNPLNSLCILDGIVVSSHERSAARDIFLGRLVEDDVRAEYSNGCDGDHPSGRLSIQSRALRDISVLSRCDFLSNLVELDLSDNNISDVSFITSKANGSVFPHLIIINLSQNRLHSLGNADEGTGMYALGNKLECLNVSNNCLSGTISSLSLHLFTSLLRLNLSHNTLSFVQASLIVRSSGIMNTSKGLWPPCLRELAIGRNRLGNPPKYTLFFFLFICFLFCLGFIYLCMYYIFIKKCLFRVGRSSHPAL